MWMLIATEALLYGVLLGLDGGPRLALHAPALAMSAVIAVLLFGGGAALGIAVRRTREGRFAAAGRLLVLVAVTGFGALTLEVASARQIADSEPLARVIAGLHTAHVGAGIALVLWVLALVRTPRLDHDDDRQRSDAVALVTAYWYFVAGVWVFVWPVVSAARP